MLKPLLGSPIEPTFHTRNNKNRRKRHKLRRSRRRFQRAKQKKEKKNESRPDNYISIRRNKMFYAIHYFERQIYKHIVSDPTIIKKLTEIERLKNQWVEFILYDSTQFISDCVLEYLKHFIRCDAIAEVCHQYL